MALAHYIGYVENVSTGKALEGAVIRVYSYPGNILQSTFADLSSTPKPVVSSDVNGGFDFYIADGAYDIEYVVAGDVLTRLVNVPIYNPANNFAVSAQTIEFVATAGQTVFNFPAVAAVGFVSVFLNGVRLKATDFAHSGATVTLVTGATLGDTVTLEGFTQSAVPDLTSLPLLAQPTGSSLVGHIATGTGAVARTVQTKLRDTVSVKDFGAVGDGTTNDSAAFNAAVAALPASGGEIYVPNAVGYLLDSTVSTGTKKVTWRVGATTITCPAGAFGFKLQSNGSAFFGSGRGNTILKLRAPASALVMPTVTTARTAGALTTATPSGGSGFVTTPIAIVANNPAADEAANDAAVIATVSGGTVSNLAIVAAGAAYVADPAVTFVGGGAGAIMIDEPQGCAVSDFSIDFQNIPNSVGVYHYGGWFCDVTNIDRVYNVSTGVSSEHSTSIGLVMDSHTNGVPGTTGSYGGVYVGRYANLFFAKRALIGHDTSTGTTLQFSTCDFKNSYIHGCVGITEINPVQQAVVGTDNYHLVNVDGLALIGGDIEDAGTWFHVHGSCNNIKLFNTLTGAATGPRRRGPLGGGWLFDTAAPASTLAPLRSGSGGAAGIDFQNVGWNVKHRFGVSYSGDTWTAAASNIKPINATQGNLDDVSASGMWLTTSTGGEFVGRLAYAGANPVTSIVLFKFDASGMYIGANKVVGARKTGWGAPTGTATRTTFDTTTVTLPQLAERVKALLDDLNETAGHGLIGT